MSLLHTRGLLQLKVDDTTRELFLPGPIDNIPLAVPLRAMHQGGGHEVVFTVVEYRNRRVNGNELWVDGYATKRTSDSTPRSRKRATAVSLA